MTMETGPGPLQGVRILDLSRVLAGPWATQLLADLGAEVIKVEKPGDGDETRSWGPPYVQATDGSAREAAYFLAANRGKRSVCIDLADPEGARLVAELAARSDVLVENFKVGGLSRYGLDYESLKAVNPRLVYCSITGFGQDGPYADRPGYDFVIQAMGGLMSLTGEADGPPMKAGVALTDVMTGLYASNAILAALRHAEQSGRGQHIDLALFDVQIAALANQAMNYLATGRSPQRWGNAHPNIAPYQTFQTADGEIAIAVGNERQFARLCQVLEMPGLAQDERFASNAARVANRAPLIEALQAAFARAGAAAWLERLHAAEVPAGPVNDLAQAFADPQARHRQLARDLPHQSLGTTRTVACPIRMSESRVGATTGPPLLGRHTREVLGQLLGLDASRLDALADAGTIA